MIPARHSCGQNVVGSGSSGLIAETLRALGAPCAVKYGGFAYCPCTPAWIACGICSRPFPRLLLMYLAWATAWAACASPNHGLTFSSNAAVPETKGVLNDVPHVAA